MWHRVYVSKQQITKELAFVVCPQKWSWEFCTSKVFAEFYFFDNGEVKARIVVFDIGCRISAYMKIIFYYRTLVGSCVCFWGFSFWLGFKLSKLWWVQLTHNRFRLRIGWPKFLETQQTGCQISTVHAYASRAEISQHFVKVITKIKVAFFVACIKLTSKDQ